MKSHRYTHNQIRATGGRQHDGDHQGPHTKSDGAAKGVQPCELLQRSRRFERATIPFPIRVQVQGRNLSRRMAPVQHTPAWRALGIAGQNELCPLP